MTTKIIKVLYNGKKKIISIDLQEINTYELFIKKINEEFNTEKMYKVVAANSSERFTILNSDNYLKILNEDIEEGLELFLSEIVNQLEIMNKNSEAYLSMNDNKGDTPEPQKEEDEDFIIEATQINDEMNKKNDEEQKNENKDENKDNKNVIKEVNKDDAINPIKFRHSTTSYKRTNINLLDREEENDFYKKKYILKSSLIRQEMFKEEKCHVCASSLNGVKYICCICDNSIICEECELYHNHPCFKYKTNFISSMNETTSFIEKNYGFKLPHESKGYTKLFRKQYDIKILPLTDLSFSLRPNKKFIIPIKIVNYSKETIKSSQFVIICKNQKNIFLSADQKEQYSIEPDGTYILKIKCLTPERSCTKETVFIEIFSNEINIKSSRRLSIELNIEVNYDSDDDKLNLDLKNDEDIYCFSKEHKKMVLSLMKSTNNEFTIKNVLSCLFENNWDSIKAQKQLKKKGK